MRSADPPGSHATPRPRNPTAKGYAVESITDAILDGTFPPGWKLGEKELSDWLGVSRTPVREALSALVADGLVVIEPHRGAIVRTITADDVRDDYAVRAALESMAVELAVPRLPDEVKVELERLVESMRGDMEVDEYLEMNRMFHLRVYSFCGSARLLAMIEDAWDRENYLRRQYLAMSGGHDDESHMHDALMSACLRGDASTAALLVKRSLLDASETLANEMKPAGPETSDQSNNQKPKGKQHEQ